MKTRFKNLGLENYDFANEFIVVCPRCGHSAIVTVKAETGRLWAYSRARLLCLHCAHTRNGGLASYRYWREYDPIDWFFHQPLWLQTPCCGETLWAYNLNHLSYIERYVRADLREEGFHHNRALANRLPRWMKLAKHREEVLKGIARLKKRACEG